MVINWWSWIHPRIKYTPPPFSKKLRDHIHIIVGDPCVIHINSFYSHWGNLRTQNHGLRYSHDNWYNILCFNHNHVHMHIPYNYDSKYKNYLFFIYLRNNVNFYILVVFMITRNLTNYRPTIVWDNIKAFISVYAGKKESPFCFPFTILCLINWMLSFFTPIAWSTEKKK